MKKAALVLIGAVAVTAVVTHAVTRYALERERPVEGAVVGSLRSSVLKEQREFLVHLPASYEKGSARKYPTLYVLDGSSQSGHTADSAALMARIGVMPETLVVGIPNVGGDGRARDYTPPGMRQDADKPGGPTGGGDRFLRFLETELVPRVERDFPSGGPRMLAGWSRGALLVVYSLVAAPALFDARFAHSPALWRDDDAMIARVEAFLAPGTGVAGTLYLSLGDRENEKMTAAYRRFVAMLEAKAPPSLRWRADITRGADHGSNPVKATPVGLMFRFGGGAGSSTGKSP